MKVYIVRHGQTDWNLAERAQGRVDIPINETGVKQAEALRDKIADIDFDICYCSPLIRAKQTAEIIVNGKCEIETDDLLMERSFGKLEGTSPGVEWLKYWQLDCDLEDTGMEPLSDVFARTKKFLEKIQARHSKDDVILVVGHGGALKTLHFNLVGYDKDTDFMSIHFKNGQVLEYEI
jgi:broad specificity phosphatase PhoE